MTATAACRCCDRCTEDQNHCCKCGGRIAQEHADYPHEPGTLYDCAACDMPD